MDLAWISVGALIIAVTLSMVTTINVGIVCLAFAWIVGVLLGGMSVGDILDGFPTPLFVTLAGVTLLFSMARGNGTLERVTERAVRLCRGHTGVLPIMFFFLALGLSTIGPGSIGATALLAPPAMAVAARTGISFFLMAHHDRQRRARRQPLARSRPPESSPTASWRAWGFPGSSGRRSSTTSSATRSSRSADTPCSAGCVCFARDQGGTWRSLEPPTQPLEPRHWLTLGLIAALLVGVIGFEFEVGMTALTAATILSFARAADEKEAILRHAVGRDADGHRRHGAHRAAREDAGTGPLHGSAGAALDAGDR